MRAIAEISTIPSSMNLSRRAALGGLAVLAVPTKAAAVSVLPSIEGTDPVVRLCQGWREIEDWSEKRTRLYSEAQARVDTSMPPPDPMIVHGPEAEALYIKRPDYGHWQPLHDVIEPNLITTAILYITPVDIKVTEHLMPDGKIGRLIVNLDKPELNPLQEARLERLTRMYVLASDYFAEIKRRMAAEGYDDDGDVVPGDIFERQFKIERALRITPAKTREGMLAKIDLLLSYPDHWEPTDAGDSLATSIARDVRRLLAH